MNQKKVYNNEYALVLEGGGMRGVYTAGVLDFFLDANIFFKTCYGVSAGACNGASYLSRQRGRALAVNTDYLKDKRYVSLSNLLLKGDLFGPEMLYDTIPNELNPYDYAVFNSFINEGGRFYAVMTNVDTGEPAYYEVKDMYKDIIAVRASSSLPMVSHNVHIDGVPYLDGGVADPIPYVAAKKNGAKKVVVVLTQDATYEKQKNRLAGLMGMRYKGKFLQAMKNRHESYNHTLRLLAEAEIAGEAFIIRPKKPVGIKRVEKDVDALRDLYGNGYEDAATCYKRLMEFLQ